MDIERLASYGDIIAIFGFLMLVYYFYKKEKRTQLENLLFIFAIAGLIVDTTLTFYRFM
jgi:uncharacterized membrane protein YczE